MRSARQHLRCAPIARFGVPPIEQAASVFLIPVPRPCQSVYEEAAWAGRENTVAGKVAAVRYKRNTGPSRYLHLLDRGSHQPSSSTIRRTVRLLAPSTTLPARPPQPS